ncbi:MAG: YncE family protein [Nitrososphaerales archaeon]
MHRALGRSAIIALLIVILLSSSANVYLIYSRQPSNVSITSTVTATSQITEVQFVNSEIQRTTTLTSITYESIANNSLPTIAVANISVGGYPQNIAVNPDTNTIYVAMTNANGSGLLAVIDGRTNKVSVVITNVTGGTPIVDSQTNMVYMGSDVINGSTNQISARINPDFNFVILNPSTNTVYASSLFFGLGQNATSSLYEFNGSNNELIRSQNYSGQIPVLYALDENASTLYVTECTDSFVCAPAYVLAINETSLAVESKIPLDTFSFFAIAVNQQSNMIYITALQNQMIVINGSSNQILDKIPITAYANEIWSITIDPGSNEIFLTGAPNCNDLTGCGLTTLYVLSSLNYGLFTTFVTSANAGGGQASLQFDPANNETYIAFGNSVLAVKVPDYGVTYLLP